MSTPVDDHAELAGRRLLVVGDIALDYYLEVSPEPWADEKTTALQALRMVGGTGANAAAAAARLGSSVSLVAFVGDDPGGTWLRDKMVLQGIEVSGIKVAAGNSTQATIIMDGSTRRVIVDRGVLDGPIPLDPSMIPNEATVYACASPTAITQLIAAGFGSRMVVGIEAWMLAVPQLLDALAKVRLVITNSAGWAAFDNALSESVVVVETRGEYGSVIHQLDGSVETIDAFDVDAVDTTGAGDCFAGALCHYLLDGQTITEACVLASIAAGLSTRALGAQSALPTNAAVQLTRFNRTV